MTHSADRLIDVAADGVSVNRYDTALIEALDLHGAHGLAHADQLVERDPADAHRLPRREPAAVLFREPHNDRDLAIERDELRGHLAAHGTVDRIHDRCRVDAVYRGTLAIDFDDVLRLTQLRADAHVRHVSDTRKSLCHLRRILH